MSVKEGLENKEEEMSNGGDIQTKVTEALDRKAMLNRLNELSSIKNDLKVLKKQGLKIPEEFSQKIGDLVEKVDANATQIKSFCEQFPELCSTQKKIESRLAKSEADKPKGVLGTNLSLDELLKHERSQKTLVDKYMGEAGLLRALERCTGPECERIRQLARKKGINIQRQGKGGMLGQPWEDIS